MKEARVVDTPTRSRRESGDRQQRVNKRNDRENTTRLLRQASSSHSTTTRQPGETRRLFFIRHAERVDLTFGHDWFQVYIDDKGYHRRNLNLPRRIPTRRGVALKTFSRTARSVRSVLFKLNSSVKRYALKVSISLKSTVLHLYDVFKRHPLYSRD